MTWYAIADNGVVYVRVGTSGAIQTNPDPDDPLYLWTNRISGTTNNLYGIAWNGSVFITVGDQVGRYSFDGVTWYTPSGIPAETLYDVAALSNVCIAVGTNGTIIVSQNGNLWQPLVSGTSETLRGVAVGDSSYIAVGDNDTIVTGSLTSTEQSVSVMDGLLFSDTPPSLDGSTDSTGNFADVLWVNETQVNADQTFGTGGSIGGGGTGSDGSAAAGSISSGFDMVAAGDDAAIGGEITVYPMYLVDELTAGEYVVGSGGGSTVVDEGSAASGFIYSGFDLVAAGDDAAIGGAVTVYPMYVVDELGVDETSAAVGTGAALTQSYNEQVLDDSTYSTVGTQSSHSQNSVLTDQFYVYKLLSFNSIEALIEAMGITDSSPFVTEYGTANASGGGQVIIEQEIAGVWAAFGGFFSDAMTVDESTAAIANFHDTNTEDVLVDDTPAVTITFGAILADSVSFDDTPTINQILNLLLGESVILTTGFDFLGESYRGVVMNLRSKAITEYDSYDFNAMGYWQGTAYGTKPDGVYRLEGADDAGVDIAAHILTAITNFGNSTSSRVERAYLGIRNDGTLTLKVIARQDDDTKVAHLYDMTEVGSTLRRERVKLGKGVRAAYFQFELSNTAGGDFEMDEMVFVPIALARRIT